MIFDLEHGEIIQAFPYMKFDEAVAQLDYQFQVLNAISL
jgi:hypothetical protein